MLTKEFIEIICNDRLSTRSSSFRLSSLIVIGSLCVVSLYMLNALEFERLRHLITQPFFQYVLSCLLLLYISCANVLVSLSKPGRYAAANGCMHGRVFSAGVERGIVREREHTGTKQKFATQRVCCCCCGLRFFWILYCQNSACVFPLYLCLSGCPVLSCSYCSHCLGWPCCSTICARWHPPVWY